MPSDIVWCHDDMASRGPSICTYLGTFQSYSLPSLFLFPHSLTHWTWAWGCHSPVCAQWTRCHMEHYTHSMSTMMTNHHQLKAKVNMRPAEKMQFPGSFSLFWGVQAQCFICTSEVMAGKVRHQKFDLWPLTFDPYGSNKPGPKCNFGNCIFFRRSF